MRAKFKSVLMLHWNIPWTFRGACGIAVESGIKEKLGKGRGWGGWKPVSMPAIITVITCRYLHNLSGLPVAPNP